MGGKVSLNNFRHVLKTMKATLSLLFFSALITHAANSYSQESALALHLKSATIKEACKELERKSDYRFIFAGNADKSVNERVDIHVEAPSIETILDELFSDTQLAYRLVEHQVVVFFDKNKTTGKIAESTPESVTVQQPQQKDISGMIVDASGEPIVGANIIEKGTTNGTATDLDGRFSLRVAPDAHLRISCIGYLEQEISVAGKISFHVVLRNDDQMLDEMVVVGYGSVKKSELTGAISTIKATDLQSGTSRRVDHMLQGQSAGIEVRNVDAAPGAEPVIRIRGMNSLIGGNEALVVIDGMQNGKLSALNYQDVQSIEILKGPSATAIYGSEGANGVIIVTTKSGGTSKKPSISFNSGVTVGRIAKKYDLMDGVTYANYRNANQLANNAEFEREPLFSQEDIEKIKKQGSTDWQDEVMGRTAVSQNYDISVSGGSESLKYYVSGSFLDQNGIVLNSGYKHYTTRLKLDGRLSDKFTWGVNYSYAYDKSTSPFYGDQVDYPSNAIANALLFPSYLPVYDEDGNYSFPPPQIANKSTTWNPIATALESTNYHTNKQTSLNGFLNYAIFKDLSLKIEAGAQINDYQSIQFLNNNTSVGLTSNGAGSITNNSSNYFQNSNILTYVKKFGDHEITLTGVGEIKKMTDFTSSINNRDFPVHTTNIYDAGSAAIQNTSSYSYERSMVSFLGRANYNYKNRYFVTASYRADASSVFGENHKWGAFPSGSIGWRVSEEKFLKDNDLIHNLMLRASIGLTGNQGVAPYQTMAKIGTRYLYPWNGGESTTVGWSVTNVPNPELKWEETLQRNVGLDLSMFKGKLEFTGDYYHKKTYDLLMDMGLPLTSGLSSMVANAGSIENQGYEFSLTFNYAKRNFYTSTGFNIATNKSKVLNLGGLDRMGFEPGGSGFGMNGDVMYLFVGQPWGQIYGWGYEGTWSTAEAEEALRYAQVPGNAHYTDLNDDGYIDDQDRMVIGNTIPDYNVGFHSRIGYKNLEFSFLIQGALGYQILDITSQGALLREKWDDRWTEDHQNTNVPAIVSAKDYYEKTEGYYSTISFPEEQTDLTGRWIQDGSYVRLKNVKLSYDLSPLLSKPLGLNSVNIFITGENLLTITKYKGYNPEVSSNEDDKALGANFFSYPVSRNIGFGLNLVF